MAELNEIIKQFEIIEANLDKAEKIWQKVTPFFSGKNENDLSKLNDSLLEILSTLPAINGWKIPITVFELEEIQKMLYENDLVSDPEYSIEMNQKFYQQEKNLQKYKRYLNKERRKIVRDEIKASIEEIDKVLRELSIKYSDIEPRNMKVKDNDFEMIKSKVSKIEILLGSNKRPNRWSDLNRHIHFSLVQDLIDIINNDWPIILKSLDSVLYSEDEALPTQVTDLSVLSSKSIEDNVIKRLKWENLTSNDFERLIYNLVSNTNTYVNPQWLTNINSPDKGRDISIEQIIDDPLIGATYKRIFIQCKHWLQKSISRNDVYLCEKDIKLWEPPAIDTLIIATSGRFTTGAIEYIENQNLSNSRLKIIMWPESHIESLLSKRPGVIAEFGLR